MHLQSLTDNAFSIICRPGGLPQASAAIGSQCNSNLLDPDIIAAEIVEDLEAALEQFRLIAEDLG